MQERYFENNGYTFKRINKKTARTAAINGLDVIFSPVNLQPFLHYNLLGYSPNSFLNFRPEYRFFAGDGCTEKDFDLYVDYFESKKCFNTKTGRYAAFYIPVKTVNRWNGEEATDTTAEKSEIYDYTFLNQ